MATFQINQIHYMETRNSGECSGGGPPRAALYWRTPTVALPEMANHLPTLMWADPYSRSPVILDDRSIIS